MLEFFMLFWSERLHFNSKHGSEYASVVKTRLANAYGLNDSFYYPMNAHGFFVTKTFLHHFMQFIRVLQALLQCETLLWWEIWNTMLQFSNDIFWWQDLFYFPINAHWCFGNKQFLAPFCEMYLSSSNSFAVRNSILNAGGIVCTHWNHYVE